MGIRLGMRLRGRKSLVVCALRAVFPRIGRRIAPPICNAPHTTQPSYRCCAAEAHRHGRSMAGVNCSLPSTSLARTGARVLDVFVATSRMAAVLSPGFAGAKPRRRPQTFSQCHMCLLGRRLQLSFGMPCPHGFPRFRRQLFRRRNPGSPRRRPDEVSDLAGLTVVGTRRPAAGFRPASSGPVASNCSLAAVSQRPR
jgi:hypothetical protein